MNIPGLRLGLLGLASTLEGGHRTPGLWLRLGLVGLVLGWAPLAAADSDHCAVCGTVLAGKIYLVLDKVTMAKQAICSHCALELPTCFVCGMPVNTKAAGSVSLDDGRSLCARDARTAVLQDAEGLQICHEAHDSLDRFFSRFLTLPDKNVTVDIVDRVHLQELFKLAGNDYDCPNVWGYTRSRKVGMQMEHSISLMSGLPLTWFQATCAHEYAHTWLNEHLPAKRKLTLRREANEGFCELVSYLFMDAQHDEAQKALILRNAYTRGQIQCFVQAEQQFGFNEVLDWMQHGMDGQLNANDLGRLRALETRPQRALPSFTAPSYAAEPPPPAPTTLILKAVFWDPKRPSAVINDRTFELQEEGKVRLGQTNVTIRCVAIRPESVRIRLASGQEQELALSRRLAQGR